MRFCILHKPMGGARAPSAPPPGYATGYKDALPLYQSKVFFAYYSPVSVTSDVKGQPQVRLVRIGVSAIWIKVGVTFRLGLALSLKLTLTKM